ncbi:MAG: hypothetical protein ACD_75C00164G0002 [uncultured bacterium]|nr:MAG: hypothetical protein ACD_75C00164G0002 [uncultured bacterium]
MAAPIVYRWDDGNAPVARGERRSLCDILYACLVTGYGTKPGAGWTREFVNATFDKAAFRNNPATGTGFYLQVDGLGGVNAYQPKVQAFETMTSESDGLFPFNNATLQTVDTSNAAGTAARPWILIADDRFFYFWCWNAITTAPTVSQYVASGLAFGDINPFRSNDQFACALSGSTYGIAGFLASSSGSAGGTYSFKFPRKSSGVLGSGYASSLVRGGGPGSDGVVGAAGPPYDATLPMLITRPCVNEGAANTLRGFVPGLFYSCYYPVPFTQLQTLTFEGRSFMFLCVYGEGGNICRYLISLDDWRV